MFYGASLGRRSLTRQAWAADESGSRHPGRGHDYCMERGAPLDPGVALRTTFLGNFVVSFHRYIIINGERPLRDGLWMGFIVYATTFVHNVLSIDGTHARVECWI